MKNLFLLLLQFQIIFLLLNLLIKNFKNMQATSPIESGFLNLKMLNILLSNQFFLMFLLFLIFDLEIALLLPMFISKNSETLKKNFLMIFLIFIYFFILEWKNEFINWSDLNN